MHGAAAGARAALVPVAAPPEGKLFLWWLVLYPVAPALMNEAPSASRGIIGAAAVLPSSPAAGVVAVLETLRRICPGRRVRADVAGGGGSWR